MLLPPLDSWLAHLVTLATLIVLAAASRQQWRLASNWRSAVPVAALVAGPRTRLVRLGHLPAGTPAACCRGQAPVLVPITPAALGWSADEDW